MSRFRLSILIFPGGPGRWTARGLEHDVAAEARTAPQAIEALLDFVRAHIRYDLRHRRSPLEAFAPAPQAHWSAFVKARRLPVLDEIDWQPLGVDAKVTMAILTEPLPRPGFLTDTHAAVTARGAARTRIGVRSTEWTELANQPPHA